MARIKHLVIRTPDPDRLADYYVKVMGLEMTHRSDSGNISLTDGYFDLSIHKTGMDGAPSGFNHFGFEVENFEPYLERAKEHGYAPPEKHARVRPFAEYRGVDPDGNNFDLSTKGYFNRPVSPPDGNTDKSD